MILLSTDIKYHENVANAGARSFAARASQAENLENKGTKELFPVNEQYCVHSGLHPIFASILCFLSFSAEKSR